ncbi:mechanosensitive ion channel family protein [Nocardioides sp. zg-536]|uniref:Mechanosensitive ion channel family protein n=2 Tax=Nocardioides faecalis TaxID=2803858 RepID=A0A938Y223_9ACTN|nr:mechanosensitive ion channel family protein [Nocardioides faecalis]MBS4752681.1 mechanosensitive ion channel family protein [Nocardioides faecalis]QVI60669.1 mechanosensitive ion channel family protein [Nocardioides faecalis]
MAAYAADPLADFSRWLRGDALEIVMVVTGSMLLARFVRWFADEVATRNDAEAEDGPSLVRSEDSKHRRAIAQVFTWSLIVLIYVLATVSVVENLGISLSAVVPAATVAGVAVGFGAQRVVQDLLAGFFLVAERQYGFGDLVRISVVGVSTPVLGTVESVSLRITTLRTVTGEVVITPNGQIVQVTNLSRDWARAVVDVPVPISVDVNRVTHVLREAGEAAFEDPALHELMLDAPSVMGVESIEMDQFKVRVVARTLPGKQFEVGRLLRVRITRSLRAAGINLQAEVASTGEPTGSAE